MVKCICLIVLISLQVLRVTPFSLSEDPDRVRVSPDPQSVTFTCSADVALAGCQFRWSDWLNNAGPVLDLSQGSQSQADPAHLDDKLTNYSYSGRGLGAGDCGVSLQVEGKKKWIVACRVRAESGGWKYAWADTDANDFAPLNHTLTTPREAVVLPGGEAKILLKAGEPLSACYFYLASGSAGLFHHGTESRRRTGRTHYLGAGLQSGECGLRVANVSEVDNGPVRCYIQAPTRKDEGKFVALIVADPPTAPTLSLTYTGTNVTAICEVQESRPVANISWILGDDVIRQDDNDDTQATNQDAWRWPWTRGAVKQTLTLQLRPQHRGRVLKCAVSHVALVQPLEANRIITFADDFSGVTPST